MKVIDSIIEGPIDKMMPFPKGGGAWVRILNDGVVYRLRIHLTPIRKKKRDGRS